jgi:hypothetical protein
MTDFSPNQLQNTLNLFLNTSLHFITQPFFIDVFD